MPRIQTPILACVVTVLLSLAAAAPAGAGSWEDYKAAVSQNDNATAINILRSLALQEIQRVLRDEEPLRPSARVSSLGVTATEAAQRRGVQAPQLIRLLRDGGRLA